MKNWITHLAVGLAMVMFAGVLHAQNAAPNVESVDILKQNQAERSRDQPGNNAPTWRFVRKGVDNYASLPGAETGVLIQEPAQFPGQARAITAGEAWRQYRNGPLTNIGGWLLAIAFLAVILVYFIFGPIRTREPPTGRMIERFTPIERITHWTVAISFVLLALSGLTLLFGKYILLPVFGHMLYGWLAYACKYIHNFVGPVFTVSIVVFFIIYVKDNLPEAGDGRWLMRLGGAVGKEKVPAGRFNAGEKLWFWGGLVFLGLVVSAAGFVLDMLVPNIVYTRGTMQIANVVHLVGALLIAAGAIAHIYLGTVGTEGAYHGMRTGYVDDAWAKEHHELWYEQVRTGEIPRVRSEEPPADGTAPVKV